MRAPHLLLVLACLVGAVGLSVPQESPGPISFYDHDSDGGEIGGTMEFIQAADEADITHYAVYFGSSPTTRLLPLVNLPANGFSPQYVIPMDTAIPTIGGVLASYLLAFSANGNGELDAGVSLPLHDRAIPVQGPTGVAFTDVDDNYGQLGGRVTISRAADESDVTDYVLYFGDGAAALVQIVATFPKASEPLAYDFPVDTSVPNAATHLLAFTANSDGLTRSPFMLAFHDYRLPEHAATAVTFFDDDLGQGEVSGIVTIGKASNEAVVVQYAVYFARGPSGPLDVLLGLLPATGQNLTQRIVADTIIPVGVTHLLVKTRSVDGEMTLGTSVPFVDRAIPVHPPEGLEFDDLDIDIGELSGTITVSRATDESDLVKYGIWFADAALQPLSQIVVLAKDEPGLNYTLADATALPAGAARLLVLTGSVDGFMHSGASIPLVDHAVPVNPPYKVEFVDEDPDGAELGGRVTVLRAINEADVTKYVCYYGTSATATAASIHPSVGAVGTAATGGLALNFAVFQVAFHTPIPTGATHFLVFSGNADGLGRAGISVAIVDRTDDFPTVSVSGVQFADQDLDPGEVGGHVVWFEPVDKSGLTTYTVFFAADATGTSRQPVGTVGVGTVLVPVPMDTPLASVSGTLTHILVYTNNFYGQGPGVAVPLVDLSLPTAVVPVATFSDMDPGIGVVGGDVAWTAPPNPNSSAHFTVYAVYFAEDSDGTGRVSVGEVPYGTNAMSVALGMDIANFTHVLVHTRNSVGENPAGAAAAIVDRFLPVAVVERLQLFDQDLGTGELGGSVQWTEPADVSRVDVYRTYLIEPSGARLQLAEVPVGASKFPLPFDTPIANFTSVLLVTANAVGEAILGAEIPIVDRTVESCPADTGHGIRSSRWRIVAGPTAMEWRLRAVRFYADAFCSSRLPTVPMGWPRRPRQTQGEPFASPPVTRHLHELFLKDEAKSAAWANGTKQAEDPAATSWWSTGVPCIDQNATSGAGGTPSWEGSSMCYVGFGWDSDSFVDGAGRVLGSSGTVRSSAKSVHCSEVEQSEGSGEFATRLALQWYDEVHAQYRTLLQRHVTAGGTVRFVYQAVLAAECYATQGR